MFTAPAEDYDRFMGRFTTSLARALCDAAGVTSDDRVLDVGCGPGGLTRELVARVGAERVAAIDPAELFAAACRERNPGADVRQGVAEDLPWDDGGFDVSLSCLVIGFMSDPDQGLREMARVTRPGGTVAACMWDTSGTGMAMLDTFWDAARSVVPDAPGERDLPGTREGDIAERMSRAGLRDVVGDVLAASADYTGFEDYWEPLMLRVGPAGQYLASLSADDHARVRDACRAALPDGPFTLTGRAWYARGTVPA